MPVWPLLRPQVQQAPCPTAAIPLALGSQRQTPSQFPAARDPLSAGIQPGRPAALLAAPRAPPPSQHLQGAASISWSFSQTWRGASATLSLKQPDPVAPQTQRERGWSEQPSSLSSAAPPSPLHELHCHLPQLRSSALFCSDFVSRPRIGRSFDFLGLQEEKMNSVRLTSNLPSFRDF